MSSPQQPEDAGHKGELHRARPAAETLARIEAEKHRFGITRIAVVTGLDRIGIPVALATRPNSRSVAVSQGKGLDPPSAKVSAVMESIEAWHAEFQLPLARVDSYVALSSTAAVLDPARGSCALSGPHRGGAEPSGLHLGRA